MLTALMFNIHSTEIIKGKLFFVKMKNKRNC